MPSSCSKHFNVSPVLLQIKFKIPSLIHKITIIWPQHLSTFLSITPIDVSCTLVKLCQDIPQAFQPPWCNRFLDLHLEDPPPPSISYWKPIPSFKSWFKLHIKVLPNLHSSPSPPDGIFIQSVNQDLLGSNHVPVVRKAPVIQCFMKQSLHGARSPADLRLWTLIALELCFSYHTDLVYVICVHVLCPLLDCKCIHCVLQHLS